MTTARDVIEQALNEMIGEDYTDRGLKHIAGKVIAALLSAPESVRLELAAKLAGLSEEAVVLIAALPAPPSEDKQP